MSEVPKAGEQPWQVFPSQGDQAAIYVQMKIEGSTKTVKVVPGKGDEKAASEIFRNKNELRELAQGIYEQQSKEAEKTYTHFVRDKEGVQFTVEDTLRKTDQVATEQLLTSEEREQREIEQATQIAETIKEDIESMIADPKTTLEQLYGLLDDSRQDLQAVTAPGVIGDRIRQAHYENMSHLEKAIKQYASKWVREGQKLDVAALTPDAKIAVLSGLREFQPKTAAERKQVDRLTTALQDAIAKDTKEKEQIEKKLLKEGGPTQELVGLCEKNPSLFASMLYTALRNAVRSGSFASIPKLIKALLDVILSSPERSQAVLKADPKVLQELKDYLNKVGDTQFDKNLRKL